MEVNINEVHAIIRQRLRYNSIKGGDVCLAYLNMIYVVDPYA